MDDEIQSLIRRYTQEIVSRKLVADHSMLPGTWHFKLKRKPDWNISKFKARYYVIGYVHKIWSPETLNLYSPVVKWATVILIFILQCIIGLQSQIIDFANYFAQADIPGG